MTEPTRRDMAVSFLEMASSGRVREAYNRYVSPGFRHHNAYFRGDRESLLVAMEEAAAQHPRQEFEVKLSLEEGDRVVTYSHVVPNPGDMGIAVVHIFRFEGEQIAEMWDVGQAIPEDSPNENGLF